jgi:hypothetical protein
MLNAIEKIKSSLDVTSYFKRMQALEATMGIIHSNQHKTLLPYSKQGLVTLHDHKKPKNKGTQGNPDDPEYQYKRNDDIWKALSSILRKSEKSKTDYNALN